MAIAPLPDAASPPSNTFLAAAALAYAERGWPVLPLEPGGKRPLGRLAAHGLRDASTDGNTIRAWWTAEPRGNIGLATGHAFDVLDIDGPDALDTLLNASDLDIAGPLVATPRGWHYYVKPTGHGNTVNLAGLAGVDWRGRGGYVVAPPSRRADGDPWTWSRGTPLDLGPDAPIHPAPAWLIELLGRRDAPPPPPAVDRPIRRHVRHGGYGAAALEGEVALVAAAPLGQRNHQLNVSALKLGGLVATGALDATEVAAALYTAAMTAGLGERESVATIKSGMGAGIKSPRRAS